MSALPKMTIVEDLDSHFTSAKTKDMKAFLDRLSVDTASRPTTLILTKERHENSYLSVRNATSHARIVWRAIGCPAQLREDLPS
eukprot:scaffold307215_cov33-Tisochrysis_lutea.AAC.2